MARLGELLVASGVLTADQVEQALRAQVMWGGRLGTNLIELGYLDLDALSRMLARQHRLPAARARHFERADRALQARLPVALAERYSVVPLLRVGRMKDQIAIATIAPLSAEGSAQIAAALGTSPAQLMPAIAAELRIAYHLERVYKLPRELRFLRPRNRTIPAFLHFEIIPVPPDSEPDLVLPTDTQEVPILRPPPSTTAIPITVELEPAEDRAATLPELPLVLVEDVLDDLTSIAIPEEEDDDDDDDDEADDDAAVVSRDRRKYVRTITDEPSSDSDRLALGRILIRRIAVAGPTGTSTTTLAEATRAIRRSTDRDRVADLLMDAIDRFLPDCTAAIVLVRRGDVAIGWKGFARRGQPLAEIGVPLDQDGVVAHAMRGEETVRVPARDLGAIDQLLLGALGGTDGDLAVVPISIGGQVMCSIALLVEPDGEIASAPSIAAAAGLAFARLMRDASR